MSKKQKLYSSHHIIGRSNNRRAKVEDKRNRIRIEHVRHMGLNSLFQCLQCPHEQLWYLREMYDSVLSDTAKELYDALLSLEEREFYDHWLVKKWALKSNK
jgi:hypothetical protein